MLVAVDDSENSVHAAETAHRLFGDTAEYLAVTSRHRRPGVDPVVRRRVGSPYAAPYGAVWSYRSDVTLDPDGIADGEKTAEAQAREVADESGLKGAEVVGEEGDPADAVLRAAEEHHVDVIVVGTHHRGWFDRLVRPSVSKEIIKESKVPVLVVH